MLKAHTHRRNALMSVLLITLAALAPSLLTADTLHNPSKSPRIVTLYQGATDSAVALGLTPIGVVDSWLEKPMYRYLRDPLNGVEHVGLETQPNLEKIAWLNPDVVIASDFRHARIAPLLNAIAPTVSASTVFNFKTTLRMVADATHHEAEAKQLLQRWDERVADFRQQIAVELGHLWPQKVAVVRFKSDHVRIYTSGFAGSILTELGFEQPDTLQSQSWGMKLSSTENIPVIDADAILFCLSQMTQRLRIITSTGPLTHFGNSLQPCKAGGCLRLIR